MVISEIISYEWPDGEDSRILADLLLHEGKNLLETPPASINRGTPLYVTDKVDALVVQQRMSQAHVRLVHVIGGGRLLGLVDLADVAQRWEVLCSLTGSAPEPTHAEQRARRRSVGSNERRHTAG